MKYFMFYGEDKPVAGAIRAANRTAHQEHVRTVRSDLRCILGGPLRGSVGDEMIGTLLVFEALNAKAVELFMADDPYIKADLFKSVAVRQWSIGLSIDGEALSPTSNAVR